MGGVALNFYDFALFHIDQHAAAVQTISGARCAVNLHILPSRHY
jgi:hypothetical protein